MPGFESDDEPSGPPPHPLDRTWLHPAELGAALRPPTPTATPRRRRHDVALALGAGVIGAVTTLGVLSAAGSFDDPAPRKVARAAPTTNDAAALAARVGPGIAAVVVTSGAGTRRGSGIALGPHDILTTADVVDPDAAADRIMVGTAAGPMAAATVLGSDPITNLVIIRAPSLTLTPAPMRDADSVRAGDWVAAVGRTSANAPWVSTGVVTTTSDWGTDDAGTPHAGLLAASTEVAADARGGALVDADGRVLGLLVTTGAAPNRARAIPIDMAADVADQILTHGTASHGALGIAAEDSPTGAVVRSIAPGSCAAKAGLQPGDRITAIDGVPTPHTSALVYELRRRRGGARVHIELIRSGRKHQLPATLDDASRTANAARGAGMTPLAVVAGS